MCRGVNSSSPIPIATPTTLLARSHYATQFTAEERQIRVKKPALAEEITCTNSVRENPLIPMRCQLSGTLSSHS